MDDYLEIYKNNFQLLTETAIKLEDNLKEFLYEYPRIDRINARVKTFEKFKSKSLKQNNGILKYDEPLKQIQDQIGARIITYYLDDVDKIAEKINHYYEAVEEINKEPKRHDSFSYIGKHFILFIPDELKIWQNDSNMPLFFELQIKTLFQHAWAEGEHDLNYKTTNGLDINDQRLIAYSSAQAWGADKIFNELFNKYNDN